MGDLYNKVVVIIPAYNPDSKLLDLLKALQGEGFRKVILVNDGSREESLPIFEKAEEILQNSFDGGVLLKHSVNLGQGRAYKTALNYYLEHFGDTVGVIQCDADGQHHIEDVCRCAQLLLDNPNEFILGVRDFNGKGIPFRSRFGNKCTSFVFNLFCGIKVKDTQTGLKGIPKALARYLIETPGERYEYATSVLLEVKKRDFVIRQFDIQTIYIDGNESSHFNPIVDSIKIYSVLLKYIFASLSAFIIDIVLFAFFVSILKPVLAETYILAANYSAKLFSCAYSFLINKKLVFDNRDKSASVPVKFILLCIVQASLSSVLVSSLYFLLQWSETLIKVIVDTVLFFVSFQVQQRWVFGRKGVGNAD